MRGNHVPGEIVPSCGWFGGEYTQVWRVVVDGHRAGIWTKPRWARRDLRWHLRHARRRRP
jgi:hypothetical protein